MSKAKVIIAGAAGRMGSQAVETINDHSDFELVGGVVRSLSSDSVKKLARDHPDLLLKESIVDLIKEAKPDILLELSTPNTVVFHTERALEHGLKVVVGATGLNEANISELTKYCDDNKRGAIIAPNFAIGAILMMKFAAEAIEHMPKAEIIELHHDKKLDAPSGTAVKTANLMKANFDAGEEKEIPIHSVRLPGLVANQAVVFGAQGQTLTIRHDTIDRSSFMPGIVMACEKVQGLDKLVYGLENLI